MFKETLKFTDDAGKAVTEQIVGDLDHNTATFTTYGPEGKVTLIRDYSKVTLKLCSNIEFFVLLQRYGGLGYYLHDY